jgi:hypothetical protein
VKDVREIIEQMKRQAAERGRPFSWELDAQGIPLEELDEDEEDPDAADQDALMAEAMFVLEDGGTDAEVLDALEAAFGFRPDAAQLAALRARLLAEGEQQ